MTRLGHFLQLDRLIEFAALCGIAFWIGAAAALYLENSHFWTTEASAAGENNPQVVNRSRKEDRLPPTMIAPPARSADPQWGFGVVEVGGPLNATITIRDANGRLVFELDPVRRTTIISKREAPGVPSSKEQGGPKIPKSRIVPVEGPGEYGPPSSRLVGSELLQPVDERHSRVQSDGKWLSSLITG